MTHGVRKISTTRSARVTPTVSREKHCVACGQELEQPPRRGRRRKFCTTCVPPGSSSSKTAKVWRAANRELVDAYNQRRRRPVTTHTCIVCGRPFDATRKDASLCGRSQCKRAREDPDKRLERERRKNERRKAARAAKR